MNWIDKIIEFFLGPEDWWAPRVQLSTPAPTSSYSGDFEIDGHYFIEIFDNHWKCSWCNGVIKPQGDGYSLSEFPIISSLTGNIMIHDCYAECTKINTIVGMSNI